MNMLVKISLLFCVLAFLCHPGFSQTVHHNTTSQPDSSQTQSSQSQYSQGSPNQSEETGLWNSQSGPDKRSLNQSDYVQTQLKQSEDQSLNQSDYVKTQLNQSENSTVQNSQSSMQQSLNQSDHVETRPGQSLNKSHNNQQNKTLHNSSTVGQPSLPQDLHWLADCKTLPLHVNLSFHNLPHLPASLFNSTCAYRITTLDLMGNHLSALDPDLLGLLTNLAVLNVSHNQLTQLPGKALRGLWFLRAVDVSHNHLNLLFPGSLPRNLEYLDMSFNRLTRLSKGVFHGLSFLRNFSVSHNQLQDIHPQAFENRMTSVMWADFSYNSLTVFDGWPYIFGQYITADFRHNSISRFTNRINVTVLTERRGNVDLRYNNLTRLLPRDLDIYLNGAAITPMMIAFYFILSIQHNPFVCDCQMHWIVKLLAGHLLSYSDEFSDLFSCAAPPFLRGRSLGFLIWHNYLLVCEVREGCPQGCECMDTPHHGHVLVSCDPHLHNYTALPAQLPAQGLVFLNLSRHALRRLDVGDCDVSRLKVLDVSHNQVSEVTPSFLKRATRLEELNLRHNRLTSLPSSLQRLSVDRVYIAGNPLLCSCALARLGHWAANTVALNTSWTVVPTNHSDSYSVWQGADIGTDLLDFLSSDPGNNSSEKSPDDLSPKIQSPASAVTPDLLRVNCSLRGGRQVPLADTSDWGMDCSSLLRSVHALVWSGVMVLLLVVGMVAGWRWRYTLRVLFNYVTFRAPALPPTAEPEADKDDGRTTGPKVTPSEKHHVYISVDETDGVSITWVVQSLLPMLETKGHNSLRVYLPMRQELPGTCKQESRDAAISSCLKFLVVLSHGYSANGLCRQELDFACVHHQQFCHKNIVIVLKDHLPQARFPTRPQTLHEGPAHNGLNHDKTRYRITVIGDRENHQKDEDPDENKGDEAPPRRSNRCSGRGVRDKARGKVGGETVVQVEVENHLNVRGAEASFCLDEDITEHLSSNATAQQGREAGTVRNSQGSTPRHRTDTLLHTKTMPVGTYYPLPQRSATCIPMRTLTKADRTAKDPSVVKRETPERSVSGSQISIRENPNYDLESSAHTVTSQAANRLRWNPPEDITEDDDDTDEAISEASGDSKQHRWTKTVTRSDSTRRLLPPRQDDESGEQREHGNRGQQTRHRERPGEQRKGYRQEQRNSQRQEEPLKNEQRQTQRNEQRQPQRNEQRQEEPQRNEQRQPLKNEQRQPQRNEQRQPQRNEHRQPQRNEQRQPQRNEQRQPQRNEHRQPQRNEQRQPQRNEQRQPQRNEQRQPQRNEQRQPQRGQKQSHRQGQRAMLEDFSQFWEWGQPEAVEPLRSFLLQGRYLCLTERFFRHKLLFELSRK